MLQVLPRWKVVVKMADGSERVFWVNDNFMANVLRKVADIQFTENGLSQPTAISVYGSGQP